MSEPILVSKELTKRFGGLVALDALDLEVEENSIHSVIGPNGAGKTTVFNCIMEFYQPDGGEIWFRGHRIDGVTPDVVAKAGINRTYQNIRLFVFCPPGGQREVIAGLAISFSMWQCAGHGDAAGLGFVH